MGPNNRTHPYLNQICLVLNTAVCSLPCESASRGLPATEAFFKLCFFAVAQDMGDEIRHPPLRPRPDPSQGRGCTFFRSFFSVRLRSPRERLPVRMILSVVDLFYRAYVVAHRNCRLSPDARSRSQYGTVQYRTVRR